MRVQGKRPRAKGMREGEGGGGNVWLKGYSACATTIVVCLLFTHLFNQTD